MRTSCDMFCLLMHVSHEQRYMTAAGHQVQEICMFTFKLIEESCGSSDDVPLRVEVHSKHASLV